MAEAPAIYRPTGPTANIVEKMGEELRAQSLHAGIEAGSRLLNTIGAVDYPPVQQIEYTIARERDHGTLSQDEFQILHAAAQILRYKTAAPLLPYELSLDELNAAAFRTAALYGETVGAKPLSSMSALGFPGRGYNFLINRRPYSYVFLYYYLRYAYCCRFVDFDAIDAVIEVGCGSGRATEILRQAHPHLRFYLLDLPPQLFVTRQRMNEAFPGALLPYDVTRTSLFRSTNAPGTIATLLPHALERVAPEGKVLSWNQMVYCIMPPKTVAHYLNLLSHLSETIYIIEPMPNRCGEEYGMSETVDYDDYVKFLSPSHTNVDRSPAMRALGQMRGGWGEACDTIWKRHRS